MTLGTISLILLTACNTSVTGGDIKKTGFVYCGQGEPSSFNPQLSESGIVAETLGPQIYDTLLTLDPETLSPIPSIASSWTVDKTKTVYTFQLRPNVAFQTTKWFTPSRFLDSRDVVFSFERIIDPTHPFHYVNGGHYPWFDSIKFQDLVKDVEAVGSDKVQFVLNYPDSRFLSDIATTHAAILSKEYGTQLLFRDEKYMIDRHPIGSGPFYLDDYQPHDFIRMKRHTHYWNGMAKMKQVVFDITQRGTGTLSKLLLNECDVLNTPISSQIPIIEQQSNIELTSTKSMNVTYIAINTLHPAVNDSRVRRAISYAINRDSILDSVYYGTGHIAYSVVPPASWEDKKGATHFNASYDGYASGLLRDAGINKGLELTMLVPHQASIYNPSPRKTAELIQANLKSIGIELKLVSQSMNSESELERTDLQLTGYIGRTPDPDNFLRPLLSCDGVDQKTNKTNWCDRDFDALLDQALKAADPDARSTIYRQAQHLVDQEMPLIPIAHGMQFKAYNNSLTGLVFSPFNVQPFNHVERLQ